MGMRCEIPRTIERFTSRRVNTVHANNRHFRSTESAASAVLESGAKRTGKVLWR